MVEIMEVNGGRKPGRWEVYLYESERNMGVYLLRNCYVSVHREREREREREKSRVKGRWA